MVNITLISLNCSNKKYHVGYIPDVPDRHLSIYKDLTDRCWGYMVPCHFHAEPVLLPYKM